MAQASPRGTLDVNAPKTTVFLDRFTMPLQGMPSNCDFLVVEGQSFPLVMPKEMNARHVWFLRKRIEVNTGSVLVRVCTQAGGLLASSKVRFSEFQGRHVAKFSYKGGAGQVSTPTDDEKNYFHLEFLAKHFSTETKKKVFLIRHAESRWNEAQGQRWWDKALSEIDHGVSPHGVEQCYSLRRTLTESVAGNPLIALVSPHRRTVQTALLSTRTVTRIHLDPRMREHTAGPDGHANTVGEQIVIRAKEELRQLGVKNFSDAVVDYSSVQEHWWSHRFESSKKADIRIKDFLTDLQYLPEESIVLVGHSRWFKRMFNITYYGVGKPRKSEVSNDERTRPTSLTPRQKEPITPTPGTVDLMNMDTDLLGIRAPADAVKVDADLLDISERKVRKQSLSSPQLCGDNLNDDGSDDSNSDPDDDIGYPAQGTSAEELETLDKQGEIERALRTYKLPNCGCVAMDFVWHGSAIPQIGDAQVIHGEIEIEGEETSAGKKKTEKDCVIC